MKRMIVLVFITIFLSGFVFAINSQITSDFSINAQHKQVVNYVPQKSLMGSYTNYYEYAILLFVLLLLIYFIFKKNSKTIDKKSSKKKKSIKRKKAKKK